MTHDLDWRQCNYLARCLWLYADGWRDRITCYRTSMSSAAGSSSYDIWVDVH